MALRWPLVGACLLAAGAVAKGLAFTGDLLRVRGPTERNRLTLRAAQERQRLAAARLALQVSAGVAGALRRTSRRSGS